MIGEQALYSWHLSQWSLFTDSYTTCVWGAGRLNVVTECACKEFCKPVKLLSGVKQHNGLLTYHAFAAAAVGFCRCVVPVDGSCGSFR
jgi:hypothetical protein